MAHESVLLKESIDGLDLREGDTYLDATLGSGGHAEEVFRRMGKKVTIAGVDADPMSIEIARQKLDLAGAETQTGVLNFREIDRASELLGVLPPNKILFDLGWSTDQFEEGGRGFSFLRDEPLVMTFGGEVGPEDTTAYDVVNSWQEENLADVIYGYGEEKYARRIAKAIVARRAQGPIKTSLELADLVKAAVPLFYRFGRLHPATRTFQAIRIAVNDELRTLEQGLKKGFDLLKEEGRMAVISFHSLEDRIVKNFFRSKKEEGVAELINKKPITPSDEEISKNPRSRSAKLRIIQKIKINN